jgi:hypothetical protein
MVQGPATSLCIVWTWSLLVLKGKRKANPTDLRRKCMGGISSREQFCTRYHGSEYSPVASGFWIIRIRSLSLELYYFLRNVF